MSSIESYYQIDGKNGPWVTFITGIANDLTMWDGQVPALAGNFRVLRYDLRGQGKTSATEPPYSIELLVQDLIALWDRLGIERSHVVGLGLGGAIALATAIDYSGRVDRLVPSCCRARMVPDFAALWHDLISAVEARGVEPIVESTVQRWFSDTFKAANPGVLEDVRKMVRGTSVAGYLGCAGAFLGLAIEDRLPLIRARSLFVSGAADKRGGPPALMAGLAAAVPGARHVSVPDAAHIANIENPQGYNRVIAGFLEEEQ